MSIGWAVQASERLICLPGTAHPARRRRPGKLQAVRPPEHQNPLKAQSNGQVENNGGGPQASGTRAMHDQYVITQVRDQRGNPQHGGHPVALRPGLAVLKPDPHRASPQRAEDRRKHQAAPQRGEGQRVIMAFAQKLVRLNQADDHQDRNEAQRRSIDRASGQLPIDQQGQNGKTQNDIEDDHLYHPSACGPDRAPQGPTVQATLVQRYDRAPQPGHAPPGRLCRLWHKHATPVNICRQ